MRSEYRILFLGDVMGKSGRKAVQEALPSLIETHKPLFTIVNGENSAGGVGITPEIAEEIHRAGADGITLGNHAFNKREISDYLNKSSKIIRPENYPPGTPGRGLMTLEKEGVKLSVTNICGAVFMEGYSDPFRTFDKVKTVAEGHLFVDFHAEATSEKVAFGWYADGRATAVVGTHTHIQTADERILPEGTAYITDAGMTGPINGVIGMDREVILRKFLTNMPTKFEVADGPGVVHGVWIDVEADSGKAIYIERIRFET